jgi:uncharacterized protein YegP (UPF0339 family)
MAYFQQDQDNGGQWYWVFHADNGKAISRSSESYEAKEDCAHSIELMKKLGPGAEVRNGINSWFRSFKKGA